MSDFDANQTKAAQEAEEIFALFQRADVNREQFGWVTNNLREQIDECGPPETAFPTIFLSKQDQRWWRLTARLNYLERQVWRLPVPRDGDTPLHKMLPQLERGYRSHDAMSIDDLRRKADECVREIEQKSARAATR